MDEERDFEGWTDSAGWDALLGSSESARNADRERPAAALRDTSAEAMQERLPVWVGTTGEGRYRVASHVVVMGPDICNVLADETALPHIVVREGDPEDEEGIPTEWVEGHWQAGTPCIMAAHVGTSSPTVQIWCAVRLQQEPQTDTYELRASMFGLGRQE